MKKIIAAIDGLKYSDSTTSYAVYLANKINAHLVGVFLDDFTYHSYKIYELISKEGDMYEEKRVMLEEQDKKTREESVNSFNKACSEAGLNYSVHHDRNIALRELLHESVFADMLIVESKETLTHYEEKIPTHFLSDLLSEAQCPVLVVPRKYKPIDKIVLLYDGEPTSVYAIRTFSYVFAELKYLDIEVVSVKRAKETLHLPDNRLMKEFMKRHFPNALFTVLKGDPEVEIIKYLKQQNKNLLVVLGAYRRGMVSRWFRPSMADILMEELNAPVFIAHNK